jgi:hypothetical protein
MIITAAIAARRELRYGDDGKAEVTLPKAGA